MRRPDDVWSVEGQLALVSRGANAAHSSSVAERTALDDTPGVSGSPLTVPGAT